MGLEPITPALQERCATIAPSRHLENFLKFSPEILSFPGFLLDDRFETKTRVRNLVTIEKIGKLD